MSCEDALEAALQMIKGLELDLERGREDALKALREVDAALAGRAALYGLDSRSAKIERACSEASRADSLQAALDAALRRIAELEEERERFQRAALDNETAAKENEEAYVNDYLCDFPGCRNSADYGEYCEEHFSEEDTNAE
jgi:hypothetical protein